MNRGIVNGNVVDAGIGDESIENEGVELSVNIFDIVSSSHFYNKKLTLRCLLKKI